MLYGNARLFFAYIIFSVFLPHFGIFAENFCYAHESCPPQIVKNSVLAAKEVIQPAMLWGTVGIKMRHTAYPKWQRILRQEQNESVFVSKTDIHGILWKQFVETAESMSAFEKISAVQRLINRYPYRYDKELWGVEDFWETPQEFFKKSGDCEDYAIAKYFALRHLGFSEKNLRIVIVKDTVRQKAHAVLMVAVENELLVLDNLAPSALPYTIFSHYLPIFSLNEQFAWRYVVPRTMP